MFAAQEVPVNAQQATGRTDERTPTVLVIGILPKDAREASGAASTLSAEEIDALRPYSMHDALDFIPGIRTIDDDLAARRSGIGIRGSPPRRSRRTLLLEDGVPINASTYLDPSSHYTPPMERLQGIEVLRGAGLITQGPLNNYGMINFRNMEATGTPQTRLDFAFGDYQTFKRHVSHRRTIGPMGVVLAYTALDADGVFDTEKTRYDDYFASAAWTIDERHRFSASFTYFRERSKYDESNLLPEEYALAPYGKRNRLYDLSHGFNNINVDYSKLDVMHSLALSERVSMATKVFATDLDRPRFFVNAENDEDALPQIVLEEPPFVHGDVDGGYMASRDRHYRNAGIDHRWELAGVTWLGAHHTMRIGIRYERHRFDDRRGIGRRGDVLNERNRGNAWAEEGIDGYPDDGRVQRYEANAYSGFIEDHIRLGDFGIIPGIRMERFDQLRRNDHYPDVAGGGLGGLGARSDRNREILPGLTLKYRGLRDSQLFANIQRGYSPAIARTAEGFPLLPEIGLNSQIGVRSQAITGLSFELAAFHNRLRNTLIKRNFTVDDLNVVSNAGDSRTSGVDVSLHFDSAPLTGSAVNVFGRIAYGYARAKFVNGDYDGYRVPEIPLGAGSVTVGVESQRRWNTSVTLSYFGSFYTDLENTPVLSVDYDDFEIDEPAVIGKVPSHTLLSARLSYALPRRSTTFWIQGRNLTNRRYISDVENGLRPGSGRIVMAGVRFDL